MKITHVTKCCHVKTTGGTERYVLELIRGLREHGISSSIGWIWNHDNVEAFEDAEKIPIYRLKTASARVDLPEAGFLETVVRAFIKSHRPDQLHFHTFGMAEAEIAAEAREQGIPYIFTYHSPAWSCRHEDLLQWGREICDGKVRPWRCSACLIQQRLKCSVPVAWALTGLLAPLGLLGRFAGGKLHRRTAFIEDTARFRAALRTFLQHASKVVACAEWSIPVLERNGALPERIVHIPQGVPMDFAQAVAQVGEQDRDLACFTVGYVGRVTPVKGVHILVEAFARTEDPRARLRIYGCDDSRSGRPYLQRLKELAGDDPRIVFVSRLPFEAMLAEYQKLNLLAIPSVWLETGPLTLLEAATLGVEVWGSETIGQMAMLEQYGRVVRPNTVEAWQNALERAFEEHTMGKRHDSALDAPSIRTMQDVACEMANLYKFASGSPVECPV